MTNNTYSVPEPIPASSFDEAKPMTLQSSAASFAEALRVRQRLSFAEALRAGQRSPTSSFTEPLQKMAQQAPDLAFVKALQEAARQY